MEETWELAVVNEFQKAVKTLMRANKRIVDEVTVFRRRLFNRLPIAKMLFVFIIASLIGFMFPESLEYLLKPFISSSFTIENNSDRMTAALFVGILAVYSYLVLLFLSNSFYRVLGKFRTSILSDEELGSNLLREDIASIRRRIVQEKNDETAKVLRAREQELREELALTLVDNLRNSEGLIVEDWRDVLVTSRQRLIEESNRLIARSRVNLFTGVGVSFFAIGVLLYLVLYRPPQVTSGDWFAFSIYYSPRLAIALLIQILASFFLKIYRDNERDISKNKNEITNLELRLSAGLLSKSDTQKAKLAEKLISEERNFIIGNKEKSSTFSDVSQTNELLKTIKSIVKDLKT